MGGSGRGSRCRATPPLGWRLEMRPLVGWVHRPGRDCQLEALREAGEEFELRPARRLDRLPLTLRAALEVDDRAVPLEVARPREDEVRLECVRAHEHRAR